MKGMARPNIRGLEQGQGTCDLPKCCWTTTPFGHAGWGWRVLSPTTSGRHRFPFPSLQLDRLQCHTATHSCHCQEIKNGECMWNEEWLYHNSISNFEAGAYQGTAPQSVFKFSGLNSGRDELIRKWLVTCAERFPLHNQPIHVLQHRGVFLGHRDCRFQECTFPFCNLAQRIQEFERI